jgi:hypothetical protein
MPCVEGAGQPSFTQGITKRDQSVNDSQPCSDTVRLRIEDRLSEMIDGTAAFLDKNRAELRRYSITEVGEKVFKTFQNFLRILLPRT